MLGKSRLGGILLGILGFCGVPGLASSVSTFDILVVTGTLSVGTTSGIVFQDSTTQVSAGSSEWGSTIFYAGQYPDCAAALSGGG